MNVTSRRYQVNLLLAALMALPGLGAAQEGPDGALPNWPAPAYWQPAPELAAGLRGKAGQAPTVDSTPLPFVALSPCRLADTRPENGFPPPFGPPALSPSITRDFPVAGHCGVPVGATAVSFNFTVVRTLGLGYLATYPQGESWGGTSTLNYVAGQVVANNAVLALGASGAVTVFVSGAQADLIIDINGYYGGTLVSSINGLDGDVILAAGDNVTITPSGNTLTVNAATVPGPPGPQGPAGPTGAQGPQGTTGPQGPQGATGAAGATGATGPQGVPGPIGPIGPQGVPGQNGTPGATGAPGASLSFLGAWDVNTTYSTLEWVAFNGSSYVSLVDSNTGNSPDSSPAQWALLAQRGTNGDAGAAGAEGPQGPAGATGATGAIGPQGPAGATGATGATGPQGVPGPIGPIGPQGVPGQDGAPGATGAQGASMSFQGAWVVEARHTTRSSRCRSTGRATFRWSTRTRATRPTRVWLIGLSSRRRARPVMPVPSGPRVLRGLRALRAQQVQRARRAPRVRVVLRASRVRSVRSVPKASRARTEHPARPGSRALR